VEADDLVGTLAVEAVQTLKKLIASGPDGELRRKADEALRSLQASEAPR